jgi:hypothetical protein
MHALGLLEKRAWENVGERTCVCHQFIFAPLMTKQSSCGTIGRRPPMLRDRLGGEIQPVRGLTVLDRFFRVHFDASRGCGPITAPLSYFVDHSARWRTVSSPGVNDTPLWHQYLHLHLHHNHYDHNSNYCHATACHERTDCYVRQTAQGFQISSALPGSGVRCCPDDSELHVPSSQAASF